MSKLVWKMTENIYISLIILLSFSIDIIAVFICAKLFSKKVLVVFCLLIPVLMCILAPFFIFNEPKTISEILEYPAIYRWYACGIFVLFNISIPMLFGLLSIKK